MTGMKAKRGKPCDEIMIQKAYYLELSQLNPTLTYRIKIELNIFLQQGNWTELLKYIWENVWNLKLLICFLFQDCFY